MGAHGRFANTRRQREIMAVVLGAVDKGHYADFEEVRDGITDGRTISRQALQCSINFLVKWGFIVKGRKRGQMMELKPTPEAYRKFRPAAPST